MIIIRPGVSSGSSGLPRDEANIFRVSPSKDMTIPAEVKLACCGLDGDSTCVGPVQYVVGSLSVQVHPGRP